MRSKMYRNIIRYILYSVFVFLLSDQIALQAAAEEPDATVLRVAFTDAEGYVTYSENEEYRGVVVDYLNEIAKYTGWTYEYVETSDTIGDFLNGKFDLLGGTFYTDETAELFAYPDYDCGYAKALLMARKDDASILSYDLSSFNGKTIGVYDYSDGRVYRLKQWLSSKGLDCQIRTYSYEDLSGSDGLYEHLNNKEVDLLLSYGMDMPENIYVAASFDSQPHYIVTTLGNNRVLNEINSSLKKIYASDPNFAEKAYERNFEDNITGYASLDEEEMDYVAKTGTVTVAVPAKWHPMFCLDTDDPHAGFVPDMLKKVEEFSGLQFSYITCDSYVDALTLVQEGKADMLSFFMGSDEEAAQCGVARTSAYISAAPILVRNKDVAYPSEGRTCGILSGRENPVGIMTDKVVYYANTTDGLKDVNRGKIDFFYGTSAHVENIIRQENLSNVVQVSLPNRSTEISFAVPRPVDSALFSILNKVVNNMTQAEKEAISSLNMVSIGRTHLTLSGIVASNPGLVIIVTLLFVLMLLFSVSLFFHFRLRAARMELGLEQARAGSRAKSDFLSRMSHEIRTPMNAIMGLADLTEQIPNLPDKAQTNLNKIKASSHYMLSLINDILDMSRIESGKMELDSTPFSMGKLLGDIESMLAIDAERRGIKFRIESNVYGETYIGDNIRLRQVILNLLSNAFKFTPEGGEVLLSVDGNPPLEDRQHLIIKVIDTGIGISAENQERVFQSFEQIGNGSSKSQGTGLGLPISRSIVNLMGGELRLKSELNKGSTFYFNITLLKGRSCQQPEQIQVGEQTLRGINILLAEDNDLNAEIAIELLQFQGATVQRALNGKMVVELFETSTPDMFQVILMDLQMPEMNGLEATRAIRSMNREDARTIPIIAMTANSFKEDVDASIAAGMTGFVSKPIDISILYSELHKAIQKTVEI